MGSAQLRLAGAGLLFLLIFGFGFWLSRSGKPYNVAIFTVHKLIVLGTVAFLGVTIYNVHQATPLSAAQIAWVVAAAVCFVATIVTGGLLSIERPMPAFVLRLHQVIPYATLVASGGILYQLLV